MKTSFKFLLIFTVVIGSVALIGTHQAQALCQGETPYGHPVPLHVTRVGKELSSDQNTLSVTVLGVPGMDCNGETITPITITASVVDTSISKTLVVDDVVADFDLNVSSLANGTYTLRVRATGGGSQTVNTPFTIERRPVRKVLPSGFDPGIAAYSEYRTKLNSSYSFSVTGGPASTTGDLYQKVGGVWIKKAVNWLRTDDSGNATKGPWTCTGDTDENIYIKWPGADENKTNEANHICVGLPTASINTSPSSILRMTGPVTISWSSSNNAEDCSGSILGLGLALGTSGNIDVNSDLNIFNGPTGGTGDPGPITGMLDVTFRCTNISGSSAQASDSTLIFHDLIVFTAKVKASCSANNSTAVDMPLTDADNIRFETRIVGGKDYFNNKPTKPDNRTWSAINTTFKILHNGDVSAGGTPQNPRDISSPPRYAYCSDIGSFVFPPDNSTQYTTYPPIYFTPACPGPLCISPPLTLNISAVGECQQNYPSSAVQSYISWNAIPGANSYTVAEEIPFWFDRTVGTTSGTSIIDRNVNFGSSYDYYVIAYNASGNEIARSSDVSASTPASCSAAPACNPTGTNVITPPQQSTNVGSTASFVSLYDPDGGGVNRYGNFNVSTSASWISDKPLIASSQGNGLFKGESAGTAPVHSTYCRQADASLDVTAQSDFTVSIVPATPQYKTVVKPGTTTYAVSISPSGEFSGNVALSISNAKPLHAGTNLVSFSPASINTSGNSTLTLSVNASAAVERYTFAVVGTSGSISHSADADLNVTNPLAALSCSVTPNPQSGTAPLTTSVSASGSGGTSPYQYQYDWTSDGSYDTDYVSSPQNHTYGSDGTYKITVRVKDADNTTALCDTSVNLPPDVCVGESCGGDGSPSVDLKINGSDGPLSVGYLPESFWGASLNISWTAENVSSCSASADPSVTYWNGTLPAISSNTTAYILDSNFDPQTGITYNFSISCNPTDEVEVSVIECGPGTEGNPACQEVFPDECWVNASPSTVIPGQSSTLSWGCTKAGGKTCSIDQDIGEVDPNGGSYDVEPDKETTYTLSCTDVPNTSATVRVSFLKKIREILPW